MARCIFGRDSLSRALDLCDEADGDLPDLAITSSPDVAAAEYLANTLAHFGYPDCAVAHAQRAVASAGQLGKASLAYSMALSTAARACQTIGDDARCRSYVEPLLAAADEHGFPQYLARGQCLLGWLTARQGDVAAGLKATSEAVAVLASLGGQREMAYVNALMADVLIEAGQWPDAIRLLDDALRRSAENGVVAFDAKLRTSKAAALANLDSEIAAAEQQFECAIDVARSQARLFELQACSGLARLWLLGQGRTQEAHLVLEPVLDQFTEVPLLPDFRKAREILAACGP